jgi:hypothetical protein
MFVKQYAKLETLNSCLLFAVVIAAFMLGLLVGCVPL